MLDASALLFIHAQTSLHPGTGAALGTVDLPIQRERHTGWPTISGSALKGILRDACREKLAALLPEIDLVKRDNGTDRDWSRRKRADHEDRLTAAFGPPASEADKHAGAISITDARILAFPVRSLKGVFAWVTCPTVLERLVRDRSLGANTSGAAPPAVTKRVAPDQAIVLAEKADHLAIDGRLVLEEFDFANKQALPTEWPWAAWLADNVCDASDTFTREALRSRLVLLHDDDFSHYVQHATEVVARIGLNYETKTVKNGALFYQEFLPAETLLYAVALASDSRKNGHAMKADAVLAYVAGQVPPVLQIGGDETIGKGLCRVRFSGKAGA